VPDELTDVAAWTVRHGFPRRIVDAAVRSGLVQSKTFSKAVDDLVELCATSEGRARLFALPTVQAALTDNEWTKDELAAFVSHAEVPEHLLVEYEAFQRSDDDLEETIRRRLPHIHLREVRAFIPFSGALGPPARDLPVRRPAPRPRSTRRRQPVARRATAASRDGPSSSKDEDDDPPGLAGRLRAALAGWLV
jgi:hypothetical protein